MTQQEKLSCVRGRAWLTLDLPHVCVAALGPAARHKHVGKKPVLPFAAPLSPRLLLPYFPRVWPCRANSLLAHAREKKVGPEAAPPLLWLEAQPVRSAGLRHGPVR